MHPFEKHMLLLYIYVYDMYTLWGAGVPYSADVYI